MLRILLICSLLLAGCYSTRTMGYGGWPDEVRDGYKAESPVAPSLVHSVDDVSTEWPEQTKEQYDAANPADL